MTAKCTGLMGRIFGHKWVRSLTVHYKVKGFVYTSHTFPHGIGIDGDDVLHCERCGAVTGEKK